MGTLTSPVARLVDDAIAQGAVFTIDDFTKTSIVKVKTPPTLSKELRQGLKKAAPEVRLLIKLRRVSQWLTEDLQVYIHGESEVDPDEYGTWLDAFVGGDSLLRWLYDFEGCLFGESGCGDAVVLCGYCGGEHD